MAVSHTVLFCVWHRLCTYAGRTASSSVSRYWCTVSSSRPGHTLLIFALILLVAVLVLVRLVFALLTHGALLWVVFRHLLPLATLEVPLPALLLVVVGFIHVRPRAVFVINAVFAGAHAFEGGTAEELARATPGLLLTLVLAPAAHRNGTQPCTCDFRTTPTNMDSIRRQA